MTQETLTADPEAGRQSFFESIKKVILPAAGVALAFAGAFWVKKHFAGQMQRNKDAWIYGGGGSMEIIRGLYGMVRFPEQT